MNSSNNNDTSGLGQGQVRPNDLLEIRRALAVLYQPGDVVELRALDVGGKTVAGYFDHFGKLAEAAAKLSGQATGVYAVLNQINPDLLARAANRVTVGPKNLTQDGDVTRRRYLPIDVDAKRPSGISSTDAEHDTAIQVAGKIKEYLIGLGFLTGSIIMGDSGNGGHLLVRVDLPNDANNTNLIKTCLEALAARFNDAAVSIDRSVFNAGRIWKLPGTLTRKGDSTPSRPHRIARLLDVPTTLVIAPAEALGLLAATLPAESKETPSTHPYHGRKQAFDLVAWISQHGIEVKSSGPYQGGTRYILKQCVFNGDHTGTSAAIFQGADGRLGYRCQHAECADKTWADLRELKEPGYKDRVHKALNLTGLPVIVVNNRQLRDVTAEVLLALYETNAAKPGIFTRGGSLVRVSKDAKGNPYIEPLSESALRGVITRSANFITVTRNAKGEVSETQVSPPSGVVKDILSLSCWKFPSLLAIIEVPVMRPDGSILAQPGYDAATSLYYHPSSDLMMPTIPDTPTESDLKAATALIKNVICDFPFDSEASGANAIATMLTPIVRPMLDGLAPLAVFDKPQPGTGASLLADVIAFIATGQTAGMLGGQRKEEEWRKAITTILLCGRSVVVIDNVDGYLNSTSLATVLTARIWRDRILGRNEEVLLPNMATWIANGNNIRLLGDLPRRAYRVRLDAQMAQPWLRPSDEFKHPDLIKWVKEKRSDIIAAMLTVTRSWIVAGKPKPKDLGTIGSYEPFCEVLGGILDYIKVKGFLGNLQQMYSEMDAETPQWENFLEAWQEVFGDAGVTATEVVKKLNENDGFAATMPDGVADKDVRGYNSRKLGGALARRKDARLPNGLMIQAGKIKHHATAWKVVKAETKLPGFSFGGELGESGSTPRGGRKKEEEHGDGEEMQADSPNSPLDTKTGELAKKTPLHYAAVLGMPVEDAIKLWRSEGAPVTHLGPGVNCLDLGKLLARPDVSPEHLEAIKVWLQKKQKGNYESRS
jgi:hypothetical protein